LKNDDTGDNVSSGTLKSTIPIPTRSSRITWLSTVQQDLRQHHLTLPKQQIWLGTALCGGWCRRMALRSLRVACQKQRRWYQSGTIWSSSAWDRWNQMMFQGIGQLCRTHDLCQGDQTLSPDMNLWHQEYQAEPSSVPSARLSSVTFNENVKLVVP